MPPASSPGETRVSWENLTYNLTGVAVTACDTPRTTLRYTGVRPESTTLLRILVKPSDWPNLIQAILQRGLKFCQHSCREGSITRHDVRNTGDLHKTPTVLLLLPEEFVKPSI